MLNKRLCLILYRYVIKFNAFGVKNIFSSKINLHFCGRFKQYGRFSVEILIKKVQIYYRKLFFLEKAIMLKFLIFFLL